ncbi:MAG: threonine ammonia-lyase [Burkholderiaceae bacterium]|nr:threonine ammonia-lyase [Burkholderiaceae bacterium]
MSVPGGDPAALGQAVAAVTPAAIERAHAAIRPHVSLTPCLEAKTLSEMLGCRLFLKFENLQFTASFKERGALNFLLGLDEGARARGVVAMSAGNHAQGVAYHAARLGVRATIFMPLGTPFTKVSRTRALGADVRIEGASLSEAATAARAFAAREAAVFLHPFDDPLVVAGQGTVALEMLEQVPELDTLVVPVGGGGLIAGMAVAASARKPGIAIVGVEPEQYGGMHQTLRGLPVTVGGDTVAEGLAVREVGRLTAALVRRHVEDVLLVEEADIERAVCWLVDVEKTVVEGAGAAGLAALSRYRERFAGRCVGVPLTGGNIDVRLLASSLLRGLARDGRLVQLSVSVPDSAGSLSALTTVIAGVGGNIVDIRHDRLFARESSRRATVELVVEAQDVAHVERIVDKLTAAGFPVRGGPLHPLPEPVPPAAGPGSP